MTTEGVEHPSCPPPLSPRRPVVWPEALGRKGKPPSQLLFSLLPGLFPLHRPFFFFLLLQTGRIHFLFLLISNEGAQLRVASLHRLLLSLQTRPTANQTEGVEQQASSSQTFFFGLFFDKEMCLRGAACRVQPSYFISTIIRFHFFSWFYLFYFWTSE